jgi:hypothetical protein
MVATHPLRATNKLFHHITVSVARGEACPETVKLSMRHKAQAPGRHSITPVSSASSKKLRLPLLSPLNLVPPCSASLLCVEPPARYSISSTVAREPLVSPKVVTGAAVMHLAVARAVHVKSSLSGLSFRILISSSCSPAEPFELYHCKYLGMLSHHQGTSPRTPFTSTGHSLCSPSEFAGAPYRW